MNIERLHTGYHHDGKPMHTRGFTYAWIVREDTGRTYEEGKFMHTSLTLAGKVIMGGFTVYTSMYMAITRSATLNTCEDRRYMIMRCEIPPRSRYYTASEPGTYVVDRMRVVETYHLN